MDMQDKILSTVLDTQRDVQEIRERIARMDDVQDKVYFKLDGFMILINRHEDEIAAVRSKLQRLEERIEQLEASAVC